MTDADVSGQITDGSGTAIGSAEVYLWREDLAGAGGVVASTTADSSGNFSFTAHPDGSGSSESWHVAAKDPNANVQLQSAYGVTASPPTSVNSQFDVSITGTAPIPVAPGETLTVDASLTNSGADSDTQTITLDIDNGVGQVDSSLEAAQGGASDTTTLSWAVPSGQTGQDYTATVSSADDTATKTVTVSSLASIRNRWLMDAGSGGTVSDSVGSDDLSSNGATWVSNSKYHGDFAFDFDGVDDSLTDSDYSFEVDTSQPLTLSVWVDNYTDSPTDDFNNTIIATNVNSGDNYGVPINTNGVPFIFTTGDNTDGAGSIAVDDGDFYHICVVYDQPNDTMTQYTTAASESSVTQDYSISYADGVAAQTGVTLKMAEKQNGDNNTPITLDDCLVCNTALSTSGVQAIFDSHPET